MPKPRGCTWCGHPTHTSPCRHKIITAASRKAYKEAPCPCRFHLREAAK